MSASQRTFLQQTLMTGGLIGLLKSAASGPALAQQLLSAASRGTAVARSRIGEHDGPSVTGAGVRAGESTFERARG